MCIRDSDGTQRHFSFKICDSGGTTLTADTWTKITVTVPGNSGLTFNNDNGVGLRLSFVPYYGTNYTSSSSSLNAWNASGSGYDYFPDNTTTWATTTNATFDITGVQLEVGDHATDFEHRSFAQELALCQRYYYKHADTDGQAVCVGHCYNSSINIGIVHFPCKMRATPSVDAPSGTNYYLVISGNGSFGQPNCTIEDTNDTCCGIRFSGGSSTTLGRGCGLRMGSSSAYIAFSAEL